MANKKTRTSNRASDAPATTAALNATTPPQKHPSARFGRETVDALVIAFAMAFLIRTFQAEQFVIPTGSMAPTLMGAHKDVHCAVCGQRYRINGSTQNAVAEQATAQLQARQISAADAKQVVLANECVAGACPNCRYVMPLDERGLERFVSAGAEASASNLDYPGDRLVVNKYAYSFGDPQRWDVIVFKYPGNATRNYIKRLVGLPGEELRVFQGDLYTRPTGASEPFSIASKPATTVLAMRQLVHDTDHDPAVLFQAGWPLRWQGEGAWKVDVEPAGKVVNQRYRLGSAASQTQWLRYCHTLPTEPVWDRVLGAPEKKLGAVPEASLITDFTPYNTEVSRKEVALRQAFTLSPVVGEQRIDIGKLGRLGVHWVGDLLVEAEVTVDKLAEGAAESEFTLELVEAGTHYQTVIDLRTGTAQVVRRGFESETIEPIATATTPIQGTGSWSLRMANFDDRIRLWVDGTEIDLDGAYDQNAALDERSQRLPRTSEDDRGDLAPAAVGGRGAELTIPRLAIWRDIYYLADSDKTNTPGIVTDLDLEGVADDLVARNDRRGWPAALIDLARQPEDWLLLANRRHVEFSLAEDQLFVMGDNSGYSLDARLWAGGNGPDGGTPGGSYLESRLLIGKATWVYWPRAWYTLPTGVSGVRIPVVPNFPDMRLVR
ncbi:signal peptidase I [Botrimarina hoheduenensis]|uniref:Signal peptidase I n=1 Tax=Botrimarina hoheduenensis TaxID=2528000 RepID=A0A5C5VXP3_9BACT|nr:signal peptidase I [Botrimarina hoheduenensis]TWT42673.1 Signal peptidase I V [Botrimarina hoheduenensis]